MSKGLFGNRNQKQQKHQIQRFNLNLNLKGFSAKQAKIYEEKAIALWRGKLGEYLDRLLCELVPPDVHVVIDKLDVSMPTLRIGRLENFEVLLEQALKQELERTLRKKLGKVLPKDKNTDDKAANKQQAPTRYRLLKGLLEEGRYPTWAGANNPDPLNLFEEMLTRKPKQLVRMLYSLRKKAGLAKRLIYQFGRERIEQLLPHMLPTSHRKARKHWVLLRRRLRRNYQKRYGTATIEREVDLAAVQYFIGLSSGANFDEKAFSRAVYEQVQERLAAVRAEPETANNTDTKPSSDKPKTGRILPAGIYVSEEASTRYQAIDVLEYFLLNGSLPPWARIENSRRLEELFEELLQRQLAPLQRLVERHLDRPYFLDRMIMQFKPELLFKLLEPISERSKQTLQAWDRIFEDLVQHLSEKTEQKFNFNALQRGHWKHRLRQVLQGRRSQTGPTALMEQTLMGLSADSGLRYDVVLRETLRWLRRRKTSFSETLRPSLETLAKGLDEEQSLGQQNWEEYQHLIERYEHAGPSERAELRKQLRQIEALLRRQLPEQLRSRRQHLSSQLKDIEAQALQREMAVYASKNETERLENLQALDYLRLAQESQEKALERMRKLFRKDIAKTLLSSASAQKEQRLRQWEEEGKALLSDIVKNFKDWDLRRQGIEMALQQEGMPVEQLKVLRRNLSKAQKKVKSLRSEQKRLETQLKEIETALRAAPAEEEVDAETQARNVRLDFLTFFLQYGSIPWWAEAYRDTSLESIFIDFLQGSGETLRTALMRTGKNPIIWRRLSQQLAESTLQGAIQKLFPKQAPFALATAELLYRMQHSRLFQEIEQQDAKTFKWSSIWELLLHSSSKLDNFKDWSKAVLFKLSEQYDLDLAKSVDAWVKLSQNFEELSQEQRQAIEQLPQDPEIKAEIALVSPLHADEQATGKPFELLELQDQLIILVDFLQNQKPGSQALSLSMKDKSDFEDLFTYLRDQQAPVLRQIFTGILANSLVRQSVVRLLAPEFFWEVVQLLRPGTLLMAKRYFKDLPLLGLKSEQLLESQEAYLAYLAAKPDLKKFDPNAWMNYLANYLATPQGRKPEALILEWKRQLRQKPEARQSSLELSLFTLEIERIKTEQAQTQDLPQIENYQRQIQELQKEYEIRSHGLFSVLLSELFEADASTQEDAPSSQVFMAIAQAQAALEHHLSQQPDPQNLLADLEWKRQKSLLETELDFLKLRRPLALRRLEAQTERQEAQLKAIKTEKQALEQALQTSASISDATKTNPNETQLPGLGNFSAISEASSELQSQALLLSHLEQLQRRWLQANQIKRSEDRQALGAQLNEARKQLETKLKDFVTAPLTEDASEEWLRKLDAQLERLPYSEENQNLRQELASRLQNSLNAPQHLMRLHTQAEALLPSLKGSQIYQQIEGLLPQLQSLAAAWPRLSLADLQKQTQQLEHSLNSSVQGLDFWANANQDRLKNERQYFEKLSEMLPSLRFQRLLSYLRSLLQQIENLFSSLEEQAEKQLETWGQHLSKNSIETQNQPLAAFWEEVSQRVQDLSLDLKENLPLLPSKLKAELESHLQNLPQNVEKLKARIAHKEQAILKAQIQTQTAKEDTENQTLTELKNTQDKLLAQLLPKEEKAENEAASQETTEENAQDFQPSTPKTPKKKEPLLVVKPIVEPLYIGNSGLVLLWPFFSRLFTMLKYTEKNAFVSEETQFKAVHILQYLVTKRIENPENELVLNKILCGLPIVEPIPLSMNFSQDEIDTAESLLGGALANWTRIKNGMEPDALRGTYLNREGSLLEEAERWKLSVQKGSFDILLKTLNWGFSFIKLPWMSKPLVTEWPF